LITDRLMFLRLGNARLEQTAPGREMPSQTFPYHRAVVGGLGAEIAEQTAAGKLGRPEYLKALHGMFWQSPSVLLVAKSAIPSEGNWAGFWGNDTIDQKLHDIAGSGPVVLAPDLTKLKVVGLTHDVAESYAPMNITVSYTKSLET
jgi:hypothetical protein